MSPMVDNDTQILIDGLRKQRDEYKHGEERWKEKCADANNKLAAHRKSAVRTEAFKKLVFDQGCYGLVFHALDRDRQGATPVPVVVPVAAFSEEDPRSWPIVVDQTCKAAVQAQGSVHWEPLDPSERTRLSVRQSERDMVLDLLGAEGSDERLDVLVKGAIDAAKPRSHKKKAGK